MENMTYYLNNEFWNIKEVIDNNDIIRFVKVNDYLTSSDRLVIFDVRTGNVLYNELNSFSTFAEAYAAYNVTNNFIIRLC